MLSSLTGLGLRFKIYGAIAILVGGFLFVRWRTNEAYEDGMRAGELRGWEQAEEANREQWDAQQLELEERRLSIETAAADLVDERQALDQTRTTFNREMTRTLGEIRARSVEDRQDVQQIESSDLVPGIRTQLERLRTVELERAAGSSANGSRAP